MGYLNSSALRGSRGGYGVTMARSRGQLPLIGLATGFLGGIIKRTGAGLIRKALPSLAIGTAGSLAASAITSKASAPGGQPVAGFRGKVQRLLPGGATGYYKRRRMNPANPKALKRAIRRTDGFVKLARRTLKGTGFTIARRGFSKAAKTRKR